jgi:hypothetical protein
MNTYKAIGARHFLLNCTQGRQHRLICLAVVPLLIGVGGALAQNTERRTLVANRAKPTLITHH